MTESIKKPIKHYATTTNLLKQEKHNQKPQEQSQNNTIKPSRKRSDYNDCIP